MLLNHTRKRMLLELLDCADCDSSLQQGFSVVDRLLNRGSLSRAHSIKKLHGYDVADRDGTLD